MAVDWKKVGVEVGKAALEGAAVALFMIIFKKKPPKLF